MELIVLNIGLQAGILDDRLFTMFVVMALVLTFVTTPLALSIYPEKHRTRNAPLIHKPKDVEEKRRADVESSEEYGFKSRFSVVLNKIEHLPAIMTLTQLLQPTLPFARIHSAVPSIAAGREATDATAANVTEVAVTPSHDPSRAQQEQSISLDALRLIELTERTSAVMQSSEADDLIHRDALLSIFRTFGHINRIPVSVALAVVNQESFSSSVAEHAKEKQAEMVIVPWHSGRHAVLDEQLPTTPSPTTYNPFDGIFGRSQPEKASSVVYSEFIRRVFATTPTDVALFVDRGTSHSGSLSGAYGQHILFPFFGGPDDRLALEFVVQLCANSSVTATVLRVTKVEDDTLSPAETTGTEALKPTHAAITANTVYSMAGIADTHYGPQSTQHRLESENADRLAWNRYARRGDDSSALLPAAQDALKRISFEDLKTPIPLHSVVQKASEEGKRVGNAWKSLLVVTGRSRRMAVESHRVELRTIVQKQQKGSGGYGGEISRTVGDVAAALVACDVDASLLVLQAADSTASS